MNFGIQVDGPVTYSNETAPPREAEVLSPQEEWGLLKRACAFEADALSRIHTFYYNRIYRYITFQISDRETARDLTAEVFIRFLTALHQGSAPRATLGGWLYGVAKHVVNDYFRQEYRVEQVELDDTLVNEDDDLTDALEASLTREELRQALRELTPDQREVLALRIGQELPIEEVARSLDKSVGAIKQLQLRALSAIARKMSGETA